MTFRLYSQLTGGSAIVSAGPMNVAVVDGVFTANLDFGDVWNGSARYLEVQVEATVLEPRTQIQPAPYAQYSTIAGSAAPSGPAAGDLSGNYPNPSVARLQGRSVSNSAPLTGQVLKWSGSMWAPGTDNSGLTLPFTGTTSAATGFQVSNTGSADNLSAIQGVLTNAAPGTNAAAVRGRISATTGAGYGVMGVHDTAGIGVYGQTVSGTAVYGVATSVGTPSFGGWFESWANFGRGVYGVGHGENGTNFGGYFYCNGVTGRGAYAAAESPTGTNYGLWAVAKGNSGRGVLGQALSNTGAVFGGRFETISPDARGVLGLATATAGDAVGVFGQSNSSAGRAIVGWAISNSGTNYGVWGRSDSGSGFGVWSEGNLGASGTKSFRIDHPFDPENKFLLHYCHEGDEPQNVYNGNVTTDANGYATVALPDYFGEINTNPRYSLTVIDGAGEEFVLARVVSPIRANQFRIRTSQPHVTVSWEVKAARNDRWVRMFGAPTVRDKEAHERGLLHPELYGIDRSTEEYRVTVDDGANHRHPNK